MSDTVAAQAGLIEFFRSEIGESEGRLSAVKDALREPRVAIAKVSGWASLRRTDDYEYDAGRYLFTLGRTSSRALATSDISPVIGGTLGSPHWTGNGSTRQRTEGSNGTCRRAGRFPAHQATRLGIAPDAWLAVIYAATLLAYQERQSGVLRFDQNSA